MPLRPMDFVGAAIGLIILGCLAYVALFGLSVHTAQKSAPVTEARSGSVSTYPASLKGDTSMNVGGDAYQMVGRVTSTAAFR